MVLSEQRKGEIAYALLKHKVRRDGIRLNEIERALGNIHAATKIPLDDLLAFSEALVRELVNETFYKR